MHLPGITLLLALGNVIAHPPSRIAPPFAADSVTAQPTQIQFDPARFDSVTAITLRAILDSVAERGLPTGPLILRAFEGAARRRPGPMIVKVVREHAAAMTEAREALGAKTTTDELNTAADALKVGIDAATLTLVRATRPGREVSMPLMVLTDIVKRGVPVATARDAVTSISRMPGSDEALLGLQSTVAKNSTRGPGMALDALRRYLRGTVPGNVPPSTPATTDRKPIRPPTP